MTNSATSSLEDQHEMISSVATTVLEIVRALVENPLQVEVTPVDTPSGTVLVVAVNSSDVGKVIGKQGRTADSLRSVIHAIGTKRGHRFQLDIRSVEQPPGDPFLKRPAPVTR